MNDDLISRQAAIDAIGKIERTDNWKAAVSMVLYDLPSAQPERKKGKWIISRDYDQFYCSVCGELSDYKHRFCPDCGADLRGDNE